MTPAKNPTNFSGGSVKDNFEVQCKYCGLNSRTKTPTRKNQKWFCSKECFMEYYELERYANGNPKI